MSNLREVSGNLRHASRYREVGDPVVCIMKLGIGGENTEVQLEL